MDDAFLHLTLNLPDPDIENDPDVKFLRWVRTAAKVDLMDAIRSRYTPAWRVEAVRRALCRILGQPTYKPVLAGDVEDQGREGES